MAPSRSAGPFTPAKALTSLAPSVRSSTSTSVCSASLSISVSVRFSKAKLPERKKKSKISMVSVPSA